MGMVQLLFYTRSAIEIAQQLADMLQNMPVEVWPTLRNTLLNLLPIQTGLFNTRKKP